MLVGVAMGVFIFLLLAEKLTLSLCGVILPFIIVNERECHIIEFMGEVKCRYDSPGLHFLWQDIGLWRSLTFAYFGKDIIIDTRLDQCYLRSLPVNSEEGAPMGIGVWYEMAITDPVKFHYENTDPVGSLQANVRNATVRCLSNLSLSDMMEDRHAMSRSVRAEVSPHSMEWGYKLGAVYIRNVHFRDKNMIAQIEEKVINRLRQVTAAIKQDGDNRVSVIRSEADRKSAIEFAKADAVRPQIVGEALREISKDNEVASALFEVLETERILKNNEAKITIIPASANSELGRSIMAANSVDAGKSKNTVVASRLTQNSSNLSVNRANDNNSAPDSGRRVRINL